MMVLQEDCVAELNNYIDPLYRMTQGSHSLLFQEQRHKWFQPTCTAAECIDFVLIRGLLPKSRFRFKFGTMQAVTVIYYITQYSGVRKLETVTVAEVNAYVLNSPLRRFTDLKGSAGQENQQERPEELSFLHEALS
ncbi:hypothetical protein HID58_033282 [Brassica napus]|uniref:Uncharacterized protein n=1 Tax=Brassica napus TaxID=3708 RepID=A0ABQ8BYT2_BRANA|nr:hypothetical protein HID58_033282 [Brassica napus]